MSKELITKWIVLLFLLAFTVEGIYLVWKSPIAQRMITPPYPSLDERIKKASPREPGLAITPTKSYSAPAVKDIHSGFTQREIDTP